MGWKDFLADVKNDDGFYPISPWGQVEMWTEVYESYKDGGTTGVHKYALARYEEKGDQFVDIPGVSWDDDYSVQDLEEDIEEVVDYTTHLVQDLLTEILSLIGAVFASGINMLVDPKIDDLALPAAELTDVDGIFLPSLKDNAAFGMQRLIDAPGLLLDLPPSFAMFGDAAGTFAGIPRSTLTMSDASRPGASIFRWEQQRAGGAWR